MEGVYSNTEGVPYGGYNEESASIFFHPKRLGIDRPTVDYTSTIVPFLSTTMYCPPSRNVPVLRNFSPWAREMLPLPLCSPDGNDSVCSFLAYSAVNKARSSCAVIRWFPNGHKLLSGTPLGELAVWNGKHFGFEDIKRLPLGGGAITALKWSPKEDCLYAGDAFGQVMTLSEALNPLENQAFEGLSHQISDLSLSPLGNKLGACADACNPIIWDVETREIERYLRALHFDTNSTTCMEWHPEKALVATGSAVNWLYLWDPRTSEPVASELAHKRSIVKLRWNPTGTHLLTCGKDTLIKVWDLRLLKPMQTYHLPENLFPSSTHAEPATTTKTSFVEPLCCSWNPVQSHIFAVGDSSGGLSYWSKEQSEKPLCYIHKAHGGHGHVRNERENHLVALDWHPLGHLLATSSNSKYIRFWSRGPPGSIKAKVLDAFQLSEIDKSGGFPISRYLSHLSPQIQEYYASHEALNTPAKVHTSSITSHSFLPLLSSRSSESEQPLPDKAITSLKCKIHDNGESWLKEPPKYTKKVKTEPP